VTIGDNDAATPPPTPPTPPPPPTPPTPTISITASDANAAEVPAGQPQNPGRFTFARTGDLTSELPFAYAVSGRATSAADYSLVGAAKFAAGASEAYVDVDVVDDATDEDDETVVLTLAAPAGYALAGPASATVTIADNDGSPGPVVPAPLGLAAAVATATQVNLDWSDAAAAGTTFHVYRGTTADFLPGAANRLTTAAQAESRYVDAAVPAAGTYYYKVTAVAGGAESAPAVAPAQNTAVTPPAPEAPSDLQATWDAAANGGQGAVVLTWADHSLGEAEFIITRTEADGTTATLRAVTNSTQLTDVGPFQASSAQDTGSAAASPPATGPTYQIAASNSGGTTVGPANGPVYIPNGGNIAPSNLSATYTGDQLEIRWQHPGSQTGYDVERLRLNINNQDPMWEVVGHVDSTKRRFVVDPSTDHIVSYRIRAMSGRDVSTPLRTMLPPAPTIPTSPDYEARNAKYFALNLLVEEEAKHRGGTILPFPE